MSVKACNVSAWSDWPLAVEVSDDKTGEWREYLPERTCHWIGIEEWKNPVECSECGVLVVAHVALDSNYCCNCGAKVVKE